MQKPVYKVFARHPELITGRPPARRAGAQHFLSCWGRIIILGTGLIICFCVPSEGKSIERYGKKDMLRGHKHEGQLPPQRRFAGNTDVEKKGRYKKLSPEEKTRLEKKIKEWKSLTPKKQNSLRHRMDQWKELTPEERSLYQKRFDQLQKLSPKERKKTRKKLKKWDSLSPRDKDEIRRKFRNK
jgi:hypothetical protein